VQDFDVRTICNSGGSSKIMDWSNEKYGLASTTHIDNHTIMLQYGKV
jgi:hypothetical protein